jgi:hypothetical protein
LLRFHLPNEKQRRNCEISGSYSSENISRNRLGCDAVPGADMYVFTDVNFV